jgi:hypothetical protein
MRKVQDVDASLLSIHPACVVSVSLTHLKTESLRQRKESERESVEREILNYDAASLIMNVRQVLFRVIKKLITEALIIKFCVKLFEIDFVSEPGLDPKKASSFCWSHSRKANHVPVPVLIF